MEYGMKTGTGKASTNASSEAIKKHAQQGRSLITTGAASTICKPSVRSKHSAQLAAALQRLSQSDVSQK